LPFSDQSNLLSPADLPGEVSSKEKNSQILKTNEPDRIPQSSRKRGGQPGNRNAQKTGQFNWEARMLRREVRALLRQMRASVIWVKAEVLRPAKAPITRTDTSC
jgi:hypothetical protein